MCDESGGLLPFLLHSSLLQNPLLEVKEIRQLQDHLT